MQRPVLLTIRLRLTLWYLAALGFILLLFAGFLYFQLQRNLFNQIDTALELAATQAQVMVVTQDGRLAFQNTPNSETLSRRLNDDFAISLLSKSGELRINSPAKTRFHSCRQHRLVLLPSLMGPICGEVTTWLSACRAAQKVAGCKCRRNWSLFWLR